jgi:predicted aspartyl protease
MEKDALRLPLRRLAALACWLWLTILFGAAGPPAVHAAPLTTGTGTAPAIAPPVAAVPAARPQQGYVIPFTPVPDDHGGPLVKVRINDKVDATFIIDTGTPGCYISESLATKLGLTATSPIMTPDGKPGSVFGKPARAVTLDRLELAPKPGGGPLIIQPFNGPFVVLKNEQLWVSPSLTADGILGATFLENFAAGFDFISHQMILFQPGVLSDAQAQGLGCAGPGGAEIPLTDNGLDQFFVSALLDTGTASRSAGLLVDTGSKLTVIPQADAKALSLKSEGKQPLIGGTDPYAVLDRAQVASFSLGDIRLLDRSVLYPDRKDYPAILGMDILKGYKVLLDYPAHKMYLMPNMTLAPVQIKPTAPTPTTAPAPAAPPPTAAPAAPATPPVPKKP